jgi:hypothetical protein
MMSECLASSANDFASVTDKYRSLWVVSLTKRRAAIGQVLLNVICNETRIMH